PGSRSLAWHRSRGGSRASTISTPRPRYREPSGRCRSPAHWSAAHSPLSASHVQLGPVWVTDTETCLVRPCPLGRLRATKPVDVHLGRVLVSDTETCPFTPSCSPPGARPATGRSRRSRWNSYRRCWRL